VAKHQLKMSRRVLTTFERSTRTACDALSFALTQVLGAFTIQSLGPWFFRCSLPRRLRERAKASGEMAARETIQACWGSARCGSLFAVRLRIVLFASLLLSMPSAVRSDDFWKHKPPAQWSAAEALKLVRRPPWARLEVVVFGEKETEAAFSVPTGTKHCDPDAIDQNGNCMQKGRIEAPLDSSRQMDAAPLIKPWAGILVRWESAAPVAQAFARLAELGEGPAAAFYAPPPRLPVDRYVITVKLEQPGRKGFEPFAVSPAGKPVLVATLKTRRSIVVPLEVEFTGVGASSSVHYFFPGTIDRVPLLGPGRDWAEFTLLGTGFTVHCKFMLDPEFIAQIDSRENP